MSRIYPSADNTTGLSGHSLVLERVTYPLIKPGTMARAFLLSTSSFDIVPVSLLLTDPQEVHPLL